MENATGAGGATPGVQVETPIQAAPTADNRSLQPNPSEQDFQAKARGATSVGAVRDLISQALKPAPPKAPEAAKPASEGQPAAEPAPAETPPAAEGETLAAEETPPAEGAETPPAALDPDEPDGPVTPIDSKKAHLRLAETDTVGRLAASFMKRNRDLSMEDAVAKAKNQLGVKPDTAKPAAETPEAPPASDLPATVSAVDEAIKLLRLERRKALSDVRMEDAADASDKIEDLQRRRSELERNGEREESRAAQAYNATFAASETKAVDLYPDAAKTDSEFAKRMAEIDREFEELKDPLWRDPEKPLRIAQMVAREMSIAPRRKGTPAAPAKPAAAPAAQPAVRPKVGMVPSGSSRTTAPLTNQPPAIDGQIKAATTVGGLKTLYKTLGIRM